MMNTLNFWKPLSAKQVAFMTMDVLKLFQSVIPEYFTFTERVGVETCEDFPELPKEGEFVELMSDPLANLFDLSQFYYSFFKSRNPKCCSKVLSRLMTRSIFEI